MNLTPRRPFLPARNRLRATAAALALAATLAATGCSTLPAGTSAAQSPSQAASQEAKASSTAGPKESAKAKQPASDAAALAARVKTSLTALGNTTKSPNRGQMMQAMLSAGAVKNTVEVSIDKTPTGLAVDAIQSAARVAKECVIGQVRDGKAAVTVLPVLATGLCFVGDQH
ncbi:DUF6993 domain-containing protein [Arthrobacter sp. STN4]|uniref:DUF6993 domain-containing protein n=1 Tax=Arthrobacter sp. STN4 TaxID=2923276 RepID=UPI002119DE1D|nr:hypothetical protein [Arthrobacter sp. STN4]MCQ9163905.1 hypothetical protein [Arthrobacter sp. STN4]